MKIYWSGAAIALLADVRLRDRSGGAKSLDQVLGEFQACCLPAARMWSGEELFRKLDSLLGDAVFMPLYNRYADAPGFPDTSEVFGQLGIEVENGTVRLLDNPRQATIRHAISGLDENAARRRALATH